MMKLNLIFLTFLCIGFAKLGIAGDVPKQNVTPYIKDDMIAGTTVIRDTILAPSEIIVAKVRANEQVKAVLVNQAITAKTIRLNPRARTFVEDYMRSHSKSLNEMKDWG